MSGDKVRLVFRYISVLLVIVLQNAYAENPFRYIKNFNIETYFGLNSGSSFYDWTGDEITSLYDSTDLDSSRQYHFEKTDYIFGFRAEYKILDNLLLTGEIPIMFSSLNEKYERDSVGLREERANLSLTQPLYFALGSVYQLTGGSFYSDIGLEIRIPPAFYNGINNNPDYDYLSDGAFESLLSLRAGYSFEKSWIEGNILYNYRDEDFSDIIAAKLEIGSNSVENTYIKGIAEYVLSTTEIPDSSRFDIRRLPLSEEYFRLGASFYILIYDIVGIKLDISAKLFGYNSMLGGNYRISAGLRL